MAMTCTNPSCFRYPAKGYTICDRCLLIERSLMAIFTITAAITIYWVVKGVYA